MSLTRHSARCALLFSLGLLLLFESGAAARPAVSVQPFKGPQAFRAELAVRQAIRRKVVFVLPSKWQAAARKLFATTQSPEDLAAVAQEVGADLVITGTIKRDGLRWQLSVSVRDGQTGRSRTKLHYPLKTPRVTPQVLRTLGVAVANAIDRDAGTPEESAPPNVAQAAPPEDVPGQVKSPPPEPEVEKEEDPLASSRTTRRPVEAKPASSPGARPSWAPYIDLQLGFALTSRTFNFDLASQKHFSAGAIAGLRADFTLYPLAGLYDHAYGLFAGLGLGILLDKPFWPDSTTLVDPSQRFSTSELRVEGGLRWRIVLYKPIPRPELLIQVGGGFHQFEIAKDTMGGDVGPPDVGYRYVSVGGGLRLHFAEWCYLWALVNYHAILDAGPIVQTNEFGPATSFGIRAQAGLNFIVYKGIQIGAAGFYEQFQLGFGYGATPAANFANSAVDQYFGGQLLVGYTF